MWPTHHDMIITAVFYLHSGTSWGAIPSPPHQCDEPFHRFPHTTGHSTHSGKPQRSHLFRCAVGTLVRHIFTQLLLSQAHGRTHRFASTKRFEKRWRLLSAILCNRYDFSHLGGHQWLQAKVNFGRYACLLERRERMHITTIGTSCWPCSAGDPCRCPCRYAVDRVWALQPGSPQQGTKAGNGFLPLSIESSGSDDVVV